MHWADAEGLKLVAATIDGLRGARTRAPGACRRSSAALAAEGGRFADTERLTADRRRAAEAACGRGAAARTWPSGPMEEPETIDALVIGGGPAGLMAAEALAAAGRAVLVAEAKPTVGRKLLMAGKSGLNLTKAEAAGGLRRRLRARAATGSRRCSRASARPRSPPGPRRLGVATFTGSSGRVFPVGDEGLAAAPRLAPPARGGGRRLSHPLAVDGLGRAGGALRRRPERPRAPSLAGARCSPSAGPRGRGSGRMAPGRRSSRRRGCRSRRSGRRTSASASPGRRRWPGTSARR